MKALIIFLFLAISSQLNCYSQSAVVNENTMDDSVENRIQELKQLLEFREKQRINDSLKRAELLSGLELIKASDRIKRHELESQIAQIEKNDSINRFIQKEKLVALKLKAKGYPVIPFGDTLFLVYTKIGPMRASERAINITNKIKKINSDDFLKIDSLIAAPSENSMDIFYQDIIIMSITDWDALWFDKSKEELAHEYLTIITTALDREHPKSNLFKSILRLLLLIIIITVIYYIILYLGKIFGTIEKLVIKNKDRFIKGIEFKNYSFLSTELELGLIIRGVKILRWVVLFLILYLSLPLIFSLFPFTQGLSQELFNLIWIPVKKIVSTFFSYIPNLITILVIYFIIRYTIRFFKFVAVEIANGKLKIPGFHEDWALPTLGIVKFLLYAFMFVVIFPFLPGSDSAIFKGMSIFLGILFSLGSSSAIANMVAGLVITYMRPFKIGDRIKIGDVTGDVMAKTLLVTRIRTIKNEEVTIPNSSILTGHTINYSSLGADEGLIIHTTVTIGYDVPWRQIHQLLLDSAYLTDGIEHEPKPFVLQTSLDDFYVGYQINAYTKMPEKQAATYSLLHQNIQDKFNEAGIEIMSPHYNSIRDGNKPTIPKN